MKKQIITFASIILWGSGVLSAQDQHANASDKSPLQKVQQNPCEIHWHTEDVDRFWQVYDSQKPKHSGKVWQREYIDKGSEGLQGFIWNRIENGNKMAKTLRNESAYYESIRQTSMNLDTYRNEVCEIYERLDSLYPDAVMPDIYFIVGRRNTGGTISNKGLLIGIEKFGTKSASLTPDLPIENLVELIAHELTHFQQHYPKDRSLLAQSIQEGSADFIAKILTGEILNKNMYSYGDQYREELKKEFKKQMYDSNYSGWLYHMKDDTRPKDLGYWMGFEICSAYFEKAQSKQQAIYDILNIKDFQQFLDESQYLGSGS